jgi:cell division protein FtsN
MKPQRGGFALGVIVGLLVGLSLALGVALYITKAPVPFVNKVPQRTAEQDQAEQQRNRNWDPNAPLAGKPPRQPAPAGADAASAAGPATAASGARGPATAAAASAPASAARPSRDPAAILSGAVTPGPRGGAEPFVFFVQAGAFTRADEAEQQRAKLAMLGHTAKVTEREQHGRVVYRVRMGPYDTRGEAEGQQGKLQASAIDSQLVRVERP